MEPENPRERKARPTDAPMRPVPRIVIFSIAILANQNDATLGLKSDGFRDIYGTAEAVLLQNIDSLTLT
jgi:hypothetical protein